MLSLIYYCWAVLAASPTASAVYNRARGDDFTGSTPANAVVRNFLGISLTDSVDFIRWKLHIKNTEFELNCNYGIGKPNTSGFYDGGKTITLKGKVNSIEKFLSLQSQGKTLYLAELNNDLLQVADINKNLLVGTGGWSYTLNNLEPQHLTLNFKSNHSANVRDSEVFVGRTPCGVPGIIAPGHECYKLKWKISFYPISSNSGWGKCRILSTAHRKAGGMLGSWRIVTGQDGAAIYEVHDDQHKKYLSLMKLDEHLLAFIDTKERLLVGDQDFSYTMNRVH